MNEKSNHTLVNPSVTEAVAVDAACFDAVAGRGKRFRGREQLAYAGRIGVGSPEYTIVEV